MTRDIEDGDFFFGSEMSAIDRNLNAGWAVKSGCAVTPNSGTIVDIAAGSITYGSGSNIVNRDVSGTSKAHAGLDPMWTTYRYDLLVVSNTGFVSIVAGTVEQKAPALPADRVLLAVVKITDSGVIGSGDIYDARALMAWRPDILADTSTMDAQTTDGNNLTMGLKLRASGSVAIAGSGFVDVPSNTYGGYIWATMKVLGGPNAVVGYEVYDNPGGQAIVRFTDSSGNPGTIGYKIFEVSP